MDTKSIFTQMEAEIEDYLTGVVTISEGYKFSQYKLIKRMVLYANQIYPKGKLTKQGDYKYWTDVIQPRIDSEVKNIDFDTKNIFLWSEIPNDAGPVLICNLGLKEWMRDNHQGVELNDAIEEGSGWGNIVWKKIKGGYERVDRKDFYVINQTARTLDETPVIERHILTQSDLRAKTGVYEHLDDVIKECGNKGFVKTPNGVNESKETPYYEIFERNGEVSVATLKEAKGETVAAGDENKYVLARIIVAGLKKGGKEGSRYVLYANELSGKMSDYYKEYHRGRYQGRWWRVGIIELLLDIQTRANEISNQIARGLEWASKALFTGEDKLIANNILTDLGNGDYIRGKNVKQLEVRMQGLDQLIADWNRLMALADKLCNSYEIVTGENLPSGTPLGLGQMQNVNANKLFGFIREKLSLALQDVYESWVKPDLLKNMKRKDVLRLTGDSDMMDRYYETVVNGWYIKNLLNFPPHTAEIAAALKEKKLQEIKANEEQFLKLEEDWLEGINPRLSVVIDGEGVNLTEDLNTLSTFIALEADPVRRQALIELAMKKKGIDVAGLPKSEPGMLTQPVQMKGQDNASQDNAPGQRQVPSVNAKRGAR